jgi:hypothetical protein
MKISAPGLMLVLAVLGPVAAAPQSVQSPRAQGLYFAKKAYIPSPLPGFDETNALLPSPIAEARPLWIECYWKAWELAFRNFYEPAPGSGFVSQFIDAAFNDNIFLWDSSFMTMFCNVAYPLVPGISTLDNFYAKQHEDGEICREIRRDTGLDYPPWINKENLTLFSRGGFGLENEKPPVPIVYKGLPVPSPNPRLTLDALNHPILSWAETEYLRMTGDTSRIGLVWEPLVRYYQAFKKYLRQGNGLYMTDWASMDNSPRNPSLSGGGTGVDISSEMVLFARHLAEMAGTLGKKGDAENFRGEAEELSRTINTLMWDEDKKFFYDLTLEGKRAPVKTVAAFWTLIAGVASPRQAGLLAAELENPATFGRFHPVPTCSADAKGYNPRGGYWRGAVWAPTDTMVIRGLEKYGYVELARKIALKHLDIATDVFRRTGTIWENYAPDSPEPGRHEGAGSLVRKDFVGWSGLGPILYLLEYGIGLQPDSRTNTLVWRSELEGRSGCRRYRFNGHVVTLQVEKDGSVPRRITVDSDGEFSLRFICRGTEKIFRVAKGKNEFPWP